MIKLSKSSAERSPFKKLYLKYGENCYTIITVAHTMKICKNS